jgi:Clustered mitochondria
VQIYDMPQESPHQRLRRATKFDTLYNSFVSAATEICKQIVLESHLPVGQRTHTPVNAGGVAGGTKYLVNGIFFKFAADSFGLYGGSHDFAQKAAGHELLAIRQLIRFAALNSSLQHSHLLASIAPLCCSYVYILCVLCVCVISLVIAWCRNDSLKQVYLPMSVIVDYLGHRLMASAVIPIGGKNSLQYGSGNAGRTVFAELPELNSLIATAFAELNLKPHRIGNGPKGRYTPA